MVYSSLLTIEETQNTKIRTSENTQVFAEYVLVRGENCPKKGGNVLVIIMIPTCTLGSLLSKPCTHWFAQPHRQREREGGERDYI